MSTNQTETSNSPRQSLPGRLDRLKAAFLKAVVPIRMRRAIFAVSLVARLKELNTPDQELAKRIGILMELTCSPASLLYPMQINSWIWKDLSITGVDLSGKSRLDPGQLHSFCTAIVNSTPEALRYNTNRAMRDDVYRLIMAFTPATAARTGSCE